MSDEVILDETEQAMTSGAGIDADAAANFNAAANDDQLLGRLLGADGTIDWAGFSTVIRDQLLSFIEIGGAVVAILALLSVIALAIILLKWWQFMRLRINSRHAVTKALYHWRHGNPDQALLLLHRHRQPAARLVGIAMAGLRHPGIDPATVREEISRVASVELERLRSHLRTLEIIATLSPLLGLLGTVLGMIEAFRQLETAGSQVDPAILSGGIWQALLTTAVGLSVAIPAAMAHSWLERKVERCSHFMEDAVTQVFTRGLQPSPVPPSRDSLAQPQSAQPALDLNSVHAA